MVVRIRPPAASDRSVISANSRAIQASREAEREIQHTVLSAARLHDVALICAPMRVQLKLGKRDVRQQYQCEHVLSSPSQVRVRVRGRWTHNRSYTSEGDLRSEYPEYLLRSVSAARGPPSE